MPLSPLDPAVAQSPLGRDQISQVIELLTGESCEVAEKAAFLTALAQRGETPEEIAGFAHELRERATPVPLAADFRSNREILDVCGTGGDRLNTFNISTTVAIVCAAAGVTVAKHGNRAVTSGSGSADVLEALGIRVDFTPDEAAQSLTERQFAFLFAPRFHPAFKNIAPARKLCAERGQRTIFNFLGPLLNPAKPTVQLVGVPRPALCEPMARALQSLGLRRAMVVSGSVPPAAGTAGEPVWMDEVSILGTNWLAEFHHAQAFHQGEWAVDSYPLQPATLADLAGGDRFANAEILKRILAGADRGPKRDAVLLGAGTALFLAGTVRSVAEGWTRAEQVIDSGAALAKLHQLQKPL
jgi:anthranilate phosphoribosyltransferase